MTTLRAVVFDLWGTLIGFPPGVRSKAFDQTAQALATDSAALESHWKASRVERETTNLRDHLRILGRRLGASWPEEMIDRAVAARIEAHTPAFAQPFQDGRLGIERIRAMGIATALVSNCTSEVREHLAREGLDGWFDEIILSADVGMMKPTTEIYKLAATRLQVDPAECLFVGDGGDTELEGAAAAGMRPILYSPAGGASAGGFPTISSHLELIGLITD